MARYLWVKIASGDKDRTVRLTIVCTQWLPIKVVAHAHCSVLQVTFLTSLSVSKSTKAGLCNTEYPPETLLKLKFREIAFVHNTRYNCSIVLQFCTEHDSITAVFCAKLQKLIDSYWVVSFGQTIFHELSVWDEFRTDILYCTPCYITLRLQYQSDLVNIKPATH